MVSVLIVVLSCRLSRRNRIVSSRLNSSPFVAHDALVQCRQERVSVSCPEPHETTRHHTTYLLTKLQDNIFLPLKHFFFSHLLMNLEFLVWPCRLRHSFGIICKELLRRSVPIQTLHHLGLYYNNLPRPFRFHVDCTTRFV